MYEKGGWFRVRFFFASGCVFLSGDHIFQKETPTMSESNALLVLLEGWQSPCPWACRAAWSRHPRV